MATKNLKYPININNFLRRLRREHDDSVCYGAKQLWLSIPTNIFDFDEFRTIEELPEDRLEKLSPEGRLFLKQMMEGKFDNFLSQSKYAELHSQKKPEKTASPAPISSANLENRLVESESPTGDSPAKSGYSSSKRRANTHPNLEKNITELIHSITDDQMKRDVERFAKQHSIKTVRELASYSYQRLLDNGLKPEPAMTVSAVLQKSYGVELGNFKAKDVSAKSESLLNPTPSPAYSLPASKSEPVATPHSHSSPALLSTDQLRSLLPESPLEETLKKPDESVSSVNMIRPEDAKPTIAQESKPVQEPQWKDVYKTESSSQAGQTPEIAVSEHSLSSGIKRPEPTSPPTIKVAKFPFGGNRAIPNYLKSMAAADVINLMGQNDDPQKKIMNATLAVLGFPSLEKLLNMPREFVINAGADKPSVYAYLSALDSRVLGQAQDNSSKGISNNPILTAEPRRLEEKRGYEVVASTDKRTIRIEGEDHAIVRVDNYDTVLKLFQLHSSGTPTKEIEKQTGFSYPNIIRWLEKVGVRYDASKSNQLVRSSEQKNANNLDQAESSKGYASIDYSTSRLRFMNTGDNWTPEESFGTHHAPPLNPLSNMPSLGALSYKKQGKK